MIEIGVKKVCVRFLSGCVVGCVIAAILVNLTATNLESGRLYLVGIFVLFVGFLFAVLCE